MASTNSTFNSIVPMNSIYQLSAMPMDILYLIKRELELADRPQYYRGKRNKQNFNPLYSLFKLCRTSRQFYNLFYTEAGLDRLLSHVYYTPFYLENATENGFGWEPFAIVGFNDIVLSQPDSFNYDRPFLSLEDEEEIREIRASISDGEPLTLVVLSVNYSQFKKDSHVEEYHFIEAAGQEFFITEGAYIQRDVEDMYKSGLLKDLLARGLKLGIDWDFKRRFPCPEECNREGIIWFTEDGEEYEQNEAYADWNVDDDTEEVIERKERIQTR